MNPQNSPPPPERARELSPEIVRSLRDVIAERWRALEDSDRRLQTAVRAAAAEAKTRGLRPEELIIALKTLEGEVLAPPGSVRAADFEARRRFREWLIAACLEAYFDAEP
jgi:hypothetical protein